MLMKQQLLAVAAALATLSEAASLRKRSYNYDVTFYENGDCEYKDPNGKHPVDGYRKLVIQGDGYKDCTAFPFNAQAVRKGSVVGDWIVRVYESLDDCKGQDGYFAADRETPDNSNCYNINTTGDKDGAYWNVLDDFEPPDNSNGTQTSFQGGD